MELNLLLSFLLASMLLTILPGPDNIFVLTESLTKGKRDGLATAFGLSLGVLVHTVAAATGLSLIIQQSVIAFSVIKYAGAAYLFYLAFKGYKETRPGITLHTKGEEQQQKLSLVIKKGFFMNVLNPKVALFFIAFLPQFVSKDGFAITAQMMVLGVVFMVQAMLTFGVISLLASKLTTYVNSPRFWRITKWSKIGVLSVLGLTLAISKK
ncbi:threonine/homoserine/homoserine lactone efflux protein [Pontibacter ummariensis]|uniref:Threonine/homoserine/homoserine lactone efflux protein n=1 Tax=Pontibacter ummariensis TaxID=1610492 RepID=A0A239IYU7_9BACT|nr:LysE family translocator [Pontibacter ummariensis]PRY08981.1 threonine/homoserine/homoserine lactone efflux protein [Pontibacter ummariensis]SNS97594.1 Threonine/homoserine/homoserine lactone efflux protein [Pontibacter ummariensis]